MCRACADPPVKPYLALLLLVASLTACARESGAPASASNNTAATAQTAAPSVAAAAGAAAAAAASVSDVAVAAKTQQEGADTGKGADSSEVALERVAALAPEGQLPAVKWVAGSNYRVLAPAQPTDVAPGKIEVIEFFWYGCPHCNALEPYLERWSKQKPPYVEFVRVPAMWGEVQRAHARLFYTLQALGKLDTLHSKVFEKIHTDRDPLYAPEDDKGTLADQLAFAKANGISESDFTTAYNSFAVQNNLQKADDMARRDRIESVPTIVINGKYVTDVGMAPGPDNLIQIINDLVGSEKHH
jgi:protein dithiol oxidoreductase (disulfide-forming)